ncbi:hypothetical protein OD350_29065 (plasmid) [Clostridium beijerinckii]|uniref:hypothetical protein n=1 Tax=Clostridium beijerinckii TaxID=1520 RepID=UPI002227EB3C|nr:hypothetical protein [Clostridium beijerinckii]UYZ38940.1 hypothetical protein OD350_29065 [Clostridium beijerinckii]
MNKKRFIIFCIVIVLFIGLRFVLININNTRKEPYTKDYERQQKIQEFTSTEKGKDPNNEICTNEGGYTGVLIKNKQALLKATNTDGMIQTNEKLIESIKYIQKLYSDSKELKESELSEYYNQNKDNISSYLEIKDLSSFSKFISKLSFIGEHGQIIEANIEENSVQKGNSNGEFNFILKLKADNTREQEFNLASSVQDSKLYWT